MNNETEKMNVTENDFDGAMNVLLKDKELSALFSSIFKQEK